MDLAARLPQLEAYLSGVDIEGVAEAIAEAMGWELALARDRLATHANEVRVAMRLVGPLIHPGSRVLEVGSGIGLFAGFLRSIHIEITELEPVGLGFQFIGEARTALADYTRPSSHLDIGVEQLQPALHGEYDLIFSLNVLEHVADWRRALQACTSVLADGGEMVHSHPNYSIPYEPHFSVPLVPFRPALTARLLPDRIAETETWSSLNWITSRQVKRWCRSNALEVEFRSGVLAETLERLSTDPLFTHRHSGLVGRAAAFAMRLGLAGFLRRLPGSCNTPVEYSIRR